MKSLASLKITLGLFLVAGAAITLSGCAAPPPPPEVHHVYHTVYRDAPSTSPSDATVVNQYDRQSR